MVVKEDDGRHMFGIGSIVNTVVHFLDKVTSITCAACTSTITAYSPSLPIDPCPISNSCTKPSLDHLIRG